MMALVMTGLCAEVALRAAPSIAALPVMPDSWFLGFLVLRLLPLVLASVGLLGMVLGGLWAVLSLWGAFTSRGPVATITREGIRDTRVASGLIPWRAVRDIRVLEFKRQRTLVEVDPAVEAGLRFTGIARWMRSLNRLLGADRPTITISAQGLKVGFDQLLSLCLSHAQASRLRPAPE